MEKGSTSGVNNNGKRASRKRSRKQDQNQINADIAELTRMTMEKIKHRNLTPGTTITYKDMTSEGYGWLLPGWVLEERRLPNGRLYKYFYGPEGCVYTSQQKLLDAFDRECGLVVLDL